MALTALPPRIRDKIVVDIRGCWLWLGYLRPDGYGLARYERRQWRAHRLVYTLLVGEIPEGLVTDHLCRVPWCVNPAHIEPVTPKVNVHRGLVVMVTHCPAGHQYTPENTRWEYNRRGTLRHCRECNRESTRRWYAKRRLAA